jgi:hypothetical protein
MTKNFSSIQLEKIQFSSDIGLIYLASFLNTKFDTHQRRVFIASEHRIIFRIFKKFLIFLVTFCLDFFWYFQYFVYQAFFRTFTVVMTSFPHILHPFQCVELFRLFLAGNGFVWLMSKTWKTGILKQDVSQKYLKPVHSIIPRPVSWKYSWAEKYIFYFCLTSSSDALLGQIQKRRTKSNNFLLSVWLRKNIFIKIDT